jgi:hypothetical protein
MSKRDHRYSTKFNRIEQEKTEFGKMEDQRRAKNNPFKIFGRSGEQG